MKWLVIFLLPSFTFAASIEQIMTDPTVSKRCKELIDIRNGKLEQKQKVTGLVERSEKLIKQTPPEKKSVLVQLQIGQNDLLNLKSKLNRQIGDLEETIVRSGCPGMQL